MCFSTGSNKILKRRLEGKNNQQQDNYSSSQDNYSGSQEDSSSAEGTPAPGTTPSIEKQPWGMVKYLQVNKKFVFNFFLFMNQKIKIKKFFSGKSCKEYIWYIT